MTKNLLITLSLILMLGCVASKPKVYTFPSLAQGSLVVFNAAGFTQAPKTNILLWVYPPNRTNYWWDLQETTNFTAWITVMSNTGPADVTVYATNKYRFYRMRGHQ